MGIAAVQREGGFNLIRSDGQRFFLEYEDDGSATLYAGRDRNRVIGLDINIEDKLAAAKRWALAYPDRPPEP